MRKLYFDIDGVFLSYEDIQSPLLCGGVFERHLKELRFTELVCVSGRSDMVNAEINGVRFSGQRQLELIYSLLDEIFVDQSWFLSHLRLVYDTDDRCKYIDLEEDWYYLDDWADKFFARQFGDQLYNKYLGNRILLLNPHGDGGDILEWLKTIPS